MNTMKRLRKELDELKKSPENDILLFPSESSILKWTGYVTGPSGTPYEGGIYQLDIDINSLYPMEPPKITFVTKVFHPNVLFKDGTICLDILKREWSPAWTLRSACRAIASLFADPEADSPLNCDAGNMIRAGDLVAFNSVASMYRIEYALVKMPPCPFMQ